jgi:hypothetical protein
VHAIILQLHARLARTTGMRTEPSHDDA